jgi:hypothetical protein
VVTAPQNPVVAWGDNGSGQSSIPELSNVLSIAAGVSAMKLWNSTAAYLIWPVATSTWRPRAMIMRPDCSDRMQGRTFSQRL